MTLIIKERLHTANRPNTTTSEPGLTAVGVAGVLAPGSRAAARHVTRSRPMTSFPYPGRGRATLLTGRTVVDPRIADSPVLAACPECSVHWPIHQSIPSVYQSIHAIGDCSRPHRGTRLCNGRVSVRPSVCPIDRQQLRAAGLLLSAALAGDRAPARSSSSSTTISSKCGQCRADSGRRRLSEDRFRVENTRNATHKSHTVIVQ